MKELLYCVALACSRSPGPRAGNFRERSLGREGDRARICHVACPKLEIARMRRGTPEAVPGNQRGGACHVQIVGPTPSTAAPRLGKAQAVLAQSSDTGLQLKGHQALRSSHYRGWETLPHAYVQRRGSRARSGCGSGGGPAGQWATAWGSNPHWDHG